MSEEKQFKASKKKLEQARRRGQVPKSSVVTRAFTLLIDIIIFNLLLRSSLVSNKILLQYSSGLSYDNPLESLDFMVSTTAKLIVAFLLINAGVGVLVESLQVGWRLESAVFLTGADKLNPARGLARLVTSFSKNARSSIFALVTLGALSAMLLRPLIVHAARATLDASHGAAALLSTTLSMDFLMKLAVAALALGILDVFVQRRRFSRELSMSLDELRRELKEDEGEPHLRSHRKALHAQLAREELTQRIRSSKVVVVDSTRAPKDR